MTTAMLALFGLFLLLLSGLVFRWSLGKFRRYPHEQFVLVGASVAVGLLAASRNPGVLTVSLLAVEIAAFALLAWYMSVGARFRRSDMSIKVGDRFPSFVLPDSRGDRFDSESLRGKTALYLFYRGPW